MEEACSRKGKLSGLLVVRFCCLRGSPGVIKSGTPSSPRSESEIFLGSVTCATFVRYLGEKEGGSQRRVLWPVSSGQRQSSPLPMAGLTKDAMMACL